MDKASEEKFARALRECLEEGMDGSVYNNSIAKSIYDERVKEFSFLEISLSYKELKEAKIIPQWYDFKKPNAAKYSVMKYEMLEDGERMKSIWVVQDEERFEAAVRILKKIHGIKDPWDDDPDWFKTHKPGDEL